MTVLKTRTNYLNVFLLSSLMLIVFSVMGCSTLSKGGGLKLPTPVMGWIPQEKNNWVIIIIDGKEYEGKYMIKDDVIMVDTFMESCQQ